jgi:hypothetical protein
MRHQLKQNMMEHIRENTSISRTPAIAIRIQSGGAILKRRAYLDIPCQNHRICLTRMLCASHNLAVEALRRVKTPDNTRIERDARLCRLCGSISNAIEDVHHALFCCRGHLRLLSLRNEFFRNMPDVNQNLLPVATDNMAWDHLISSWADELDSAIPLSRLAWHVSRLFYEHAILMPALPPMTVDPVIVDWDPASDYSSEDDDAMPTESVER